MTLAPMGDSVRAILYDRVSTKNQARSGYSGGTDGFQLDRCRAYADARNWSVIDTLTDVDSGAKWDIDGIMEALERAKRGEYDVLIVSDTSRFARDAVKKMVYERDLEKRGVKVVYTNLPDLPQDDSPDTRLTNNIMRGVYGAMDEYERDKIAWRTKHGRRKKAEMGKVVGGGPAPFGYRYVTVWDETKKKHVPISLEPNPDTADIVRRLFRDIAQMSSIDLAAALTDEGVATATRRNERWFKSSVRRILNNSVYKGEWYYAGIMVRVPALIDDRTWEHAQQLLSERQRARKGRDMERAHLWELRGLLSCGHCDGLLSTNSNPIASKSTQWPNGRQRRYACARSVPSWAKEAGWDLCVLPGLLAADERIGATTRELVGIEEHAWGVVSTVLLDPERFNAELDRLAEQHADARNDHDERLQILDAEISKHERMLRRASEEKLKVELDDERYTMYDEAEQRASDKLRSLRREREAFAARPVPGLSRDERAELAQAAQEMRAGIEHADAATRRRVYELLRLRGRIFEDRERGVRIGRDARIRVEWESVLTLGSEHGVLRLCAVSRSDSTSITRVERVAHAA